VVATVRAGRALAAALLGAAAVATVARGAAAAPFARDGAVFGFDVGWGRARLDYENLVESARFPRGAQDGFTFDLRVGYAASRALLLALHLGGWFGSVTTERLPGAWPGPADDDWTLSTVGGSASWFPRGGPLFLRAGLGRALGSVTFADPGGYEQIFRDAGLAARLGAGWCLPLGPEFALTPTLEFHALDLGSGDQAYVWSLALGVTAW